MRPYLANLSAQLRQQLQYRAAAAAGVATQVFWGLIRTMIFSAFYAGVSPGTAPMDLEQVVAYVWLGQAFLMFTPLAGADHELLWRIRTGGVVYDLLRPLDMYGFWYSRMLAVKIAPTILRAIPILVLATIMGWIEWPAWPVIAAWLASMVAAALLGCALATGVAVTAFWTMSGQGVLQLTTALGLLLSGLVIPLPLFPAWLQPLLYALPFRGLIDIPFRIFTGHLPLAELPALLAHQLAWTATLVLAGRYLTSRAVRRVIVQGG